MTGLSNQPVFFMDFGSRSLALDSPRVMGVLNVTPDSFSDGGQHFSSHRLSISSCLKKARRLVDEGAAFVDVGGESTRPGAKPIGVQEELDRVLPVVEAIVAELDVIVSVDTSSAAVITEAAKLGAGLINDVRALEREGALEAALSVNLPVCLMHMQGGPQTMQVSPEYDSVVTDVLEYLAARIDICEAAGIDRARVLVDPGIGFGKTDAHNLALIKKLRTFECLQCPILIGVSRKSMIGRLLNKPVSDRLAGSIAFAMESVRRGAKIVRVHDVAETVDALKVYAYLEENNE